MEQSASVLGALEAQKLPSQAQISSWIDWSVSQIDQTTQSAPGRSQLSSHGKKLAGDLKTLLLTYKELGIHKNYDDQLQNIIWHLTQCRNNVAAEGLKVSQEVKDEITADAQQFSSALQYILLVFLGHFTSVEDGSDLDSLIRRVLADTAEVVEGEAASIKEQLRETEEQAQRGDKGGPGPGLTEGAASPGATRAFEAGMETAKVSGSQVGGEVGTRTTRNIDEVLDSILQRAEYDEVYRDSITTLFHILSKWFDKSLAAADKISIENVVNDPSGHISSAWSSLNILLERLAGGRSTHDIIQAFRTIATHLREDSELHKYFDDINNFVRRTLREPTFARSNEHAQQRAQLRDRWHQLQRDERRTFHSDLEMLRAEARGYIRRIQQDPDVYALRKACTALGKDSDELAETLRAAFMGNLNWIWKDAVNVLLPQVLENVKNLPIPRMEYKDSEIEFVIEDLDISTLRLLPGRANVRNITDMSISKESGDQDPSTEFKSLTLIRLSGVQCKIKDVSFWYHDEYMRPISSISGILGITIPEHGVDADIVLGFLPEKDKKPAKPSEQAFLSVDSVAVFLNNPEITLRRTNHPILLTAFKPIFRLRLEHAIEAALEQHIRTTIRCLDGVAYDAHWRAGVFREAGLTPSAAYTSAIWSEIQHLKHLPGFWSGLKTTGAGIVSDDPRTDVKFAIGTRPQIISGEKHGPEVPGSGTQERREQAASTAEESTRYAKESAYGVTSFTDEVRIKKERERYNEGWRSGAFDISQRA